MEFDDCRRAIVSGLKWVVAQQLGDGQFKPAEFGMCGYHKVPYALSLVGQTERAGRLLSWIDRNAFDEEGDFTDPHGRQGPMADYYNYPNAWLIMAAHRLEAYDMSYRAIDFLTSLQHPDTGGFLTGGPTSGLDGRQDILSTAVAGLACVQCGAIDTANRAGRFLVNIFNSQPRIGVRMYFFIEDTDQFVTEYDDEEASSHALMLDRSHQWYFVPGMAAYFLAKLYQATGTDVFLDGAHNYVRFCDSSGEDRYGDARSGAFGLAAAVLYAMTDVNNYATIADEVAGNIISAQMGNGSWAEGSMGFVPPAPILDATAENVVILTHMLQTLSTV